MTKTRQKEDTVSEKKDPKDMDNEELLDALRKAIEKGDKR